MNLFPAALLLSVAALVALIVGGVLASRVGIVRRVQGRLLITIGAFAAIALVSSGLLWNIPALSGIPLLLSPGLAAAIGVCLFGLVPFRDRDRASLRTASLSARTPSTVMTRRMILVPTATLTVLVTALCITGSTADANGVSLSIQAGLSFGPYPGWFYGLPILTAAAVLAGATIAAVRRSVLLPGTGIAGEDDERWRRFIGSTLSAIATSGLLLYLAEVVWLTGKSLDYAARSVAGGDATLSTLGSILVTAAPVLLIGAVALLVTACLGLRRLSPSLVAENSGRA